MIKENKYKRLPNTNFFGMYVGTDNQGRTSLLVRLSKKPKIKGNSKYLRYDLNQRVDSKWAFVISIDNNSYKSVFMKLVNNLVEAIKDESHSIVAEKLFIQELEKWQTLFDSEVSLKLEFSKVVGLIGELFFLYTFLKTNVGINDAIKSWGGPQGANKDFQTTNTWFEIKTKSLSKTTVHMNNHMQLDSEELGYLTVISFEKSSEANDKSWNLNKLYDAISREIIDKAIQEEFDSKLNLIGFIQKEDYKEINVQLHSIEFYLVDKYFPKIMTSGTSSTIINLQYDLFLPELKEFIKDDVSGSL